MDIASVIVTFMLTCRVLSRSIRDTGAISALPPTVPRLFKLPIRSQNTLRSQNRLHSGANRVIQGSFGCICPHTFALPAHSFSRILEGDCAPTTSPFHNPFGINESRTLGIFATKCASANFFAINLSRTLLQKPGGRVLPLPAVADVLARRQVIRCHTRCRPVGAPL